MEFQEVQMVTLPVSSLRQLVRSEVDRALRRLGVEARPQTDVEPDEVADVATEYDAGFWNPVWFADLPETVSESEVTGLVDDHGQPLPSTMPQVAEMSISSSEAAELLGVNSSRIRQRLGDGSLYGFKFEGSWRLPKWQFEGSTTIPHLDRVVAALRPSESPVGVTRWFISPWEDLVTPRGELVSPRRWLLEGRDPSPVLAQARMP